MNSMTKKFSPDLLDTAPRTPVAPRCYTTHKPLSLGGSLVIHGGSCYSPIVTDADIYVGLDRGMPSPKQAYPWEPGHSFLFEIEDGTAPKDKASFIAMIDWLAAQISDGKKVHVGCIGGHGRTGTVLSALVKVMLSDKDASEYIRANYCKKAIETKAQVAFLSSVFGINPVKERHAEIGNRTFLPSYGKGLYTEDGFYDRLDNNILPMKSKPVSAFSKLVKHGTFNNIASPGCMWGKSFVGPPDIKV